MSIKKYGSGKLLKILFIQLKKIILSLHTSMKTRKTQYEHAKKKIK